MRSFFHYRKKIHFKKVVRNLNRKFTRTSSNYNYFLVMYVTYNLKQNCYRMDLKIKVIDTLFY